MIKFALYAALVLLPFLSFAGNRCDICGKDISLAKNARQCAACAVRETFRKITGRAGSSDQDIPRIKAERIARQVGNAAVWNLICYNQQLPVNLVVSSKEHRLNCSLVFQMKDKSKRIRLVLKDAAVTYAIGEKEGELVKHCGIYILDNLPVCLPGKRRMTLVVNRNKLDSLEYLLIADDGTGRDQRMIQGVAKSGKITDFKHFY
ncbi:MAG: hypothetical protein IKO93_07065 [Lentisphaeria bacterium]|nr:hypothetical protein [Lentisphaeria bacterium]